VERIDTVIDQLDLTIKLIRTAIFQLQDTPAGTTQGVRGRLLAVAADAAGPLGFEPAMLFHGPVDIMIGQQAADELTAALTEALSNTAHHAHANGVFVALVVSDSILLRVEDDGIGPPPPDAAHGNGLNNMTTRAKRLGGTLTMRQGPRGGTLIEWRIPLNIH
jgi:signal transduction histidine kinase